MGWRHPNLECKNFFLSSQFQLNFLLTSDLALFESWVNIEMDSNIRRLLWRQKSLEILVLVVNFKELVVQLLVLVWQQLLSKVILVVEFFRFNHFAQWVILKDWLSSHSLVILQITDPYSKSRIHWVIKAIQIIIKSEIH